MNHKNTVVFYHAGCMDGILAAVALKSKLSIDANVYLYPLGYQYDGQRDDIENTVEVSQADTIYFCDVIPTQENLTFVLENYVKENGLSVNIIDHHPGVEETVDVCILESDLSESDLLRFNLIYSKERSGCGLVLDEMAFFTENQNKNFERVLQVANNYDLWLHNGEINSDETFLSLLFYKEYNNVKFLFAKTLEEYKDAVIQKPSEALTELRALGTILEGVVGKVVDKFPSSALKDELLDQLTDDIENQQADMVLIEVQTKEFGLMNFPIGLFDGELRNETSQYARKLDLYTAAVFQFRTLNSGDLKFSIRTGNTIKYQQFGGPVMAFRFDCNAFAKTQFNGGGHSSAGAFTLSKDEANEDRLLHLGLFLSNCIVKYLTDVEHLTVVYTGLQKTTWSRYIGHEGDGYREDGDIRLLGNNN